MPLRNHASARKAGTAFERTTADYLAGALADDRIDRRVKTGAKDRGDIAGVRVRGQRIVIECKSCQYETCRHCKRVSGLKLAAWTDEARAEAGNDDALVGVVVIKRHGTIDPGRQWVAMTLDDLLALITGEHIGPAL